MIALCLLIIDKIIISAHVFFIKSQGVIIKYLFLGQYIISSWSQDKQKQKFKWRQETNYCAIRRKSPPSSPGFQYLLTMSDWDLAPSKIYTHNRLKIQGCILFHIERILLWCLQWSMICQRWCCIFPFLNEPVNYWVAVGCYRQNNLWTTTSSLTQTFIHTGTRKS